MGNKNKNPEVHSYKTLDYKGNRIFAKIEMGDFDRILKLFTEKEACFMFIDNGHFLMRTPKALIPFKSGDGMLAKCGNYYFENKLEKGSPENKTIMVSVYFYPSILEELFDNNFTTPTYRTDYDAHKVKIDKLLLNFKENIIFLLDNPEVVDEALILTKLKEFVILLSKTEQAPGLIDFMSSLFKPIEYHFRSIIEKHLFSSLSLAEFATLCNMSLATFKRRFREIYAESPRKYISKKKMEKALKMLYSKENRIIDIAYDCGFDSLSTFNRNFKNYHGKSPTQYKNSTPAPN